MPLIETFGLSRRFEEMVAGDDLNLTVETGEVLGLLGPNKEPKGDPLRPNRNPERGAVGGVCFFLPSSGSPGFGPLRVQER